MKLLDTFEIAFANLQTGIHEYEFELNDEFFECFEDTEIKKSQTHSKIILHRKNNMLDLEFKLNGKVEMKCDRCLENYWQDIESHNWLYVKFGDTYEEQSEDVIIISRNDSRINVAQFLYEFAVLSLPVKRVHGEGVDPNEKCDQKVIDELEKYLVDASGKKKKTDNKNETHDARWDELKKLKFN